MKSEKHDPPKDSSEIITWQLGNLQCSVFNAGSFRSDGGAGMGVFPKALWEKQITPDSLNRIELATNLILVKTEQFNLLVDTGIGYYSPKKLEKIYQPEPSRLLEHLQRCGCNREDLDYIILTHLHHDHIGGIIFKENHVEELMFPQAKHIIQKREWETANSPDELNQAAYQFNKPLTLLQNSPNLMLIDGNYDLSPEITIYAVGGHSVGSQIVRIESESQLCYYPGDIIPHIFHMNLAVTSAYDIARQQTFAAKKIILQELEEKKGYLIFNHQPEKKLIKFPLS